MLVSTFTKMVEKRGMHWERFNTFMDRYIKIFGQRQCATRLIKLDEIQHMGWLEARGLLRDLQKKDTFEADYADTLEASKQEEGAK